MYLSYYGLRERPFDLTPNPRFVLLTPRHDEALSMLQYGVESRKGIVVLTGEAGTGKTTLLRAAMSNIQETGVGHLRQQSQADARRVPRVSGGGVRPVA